MVGAWWGHGTIILLTIYYSVQESIIDVVLSIPANIHNSLIGQKGKLIRSIMDDCGGVRIQFPPSGSKKDEIKLHGPKEDVKKAEGMLMELAEEQVREGRGGEGEGRERRGEGGY